MHRLLLLAVACTSSVDDDDGVGGADASAAVDAADPADARPLPTCSDGDPVSFSADVQPIFTASCNDNACHDSMASAAGLDLTEGNAYAELVGVQAFQCDRSRVVAGSVAGSYLVNKLTGIDMCSGTLMPKIDMALSEDELDTIVAWICDGALED
jgi:hypothetical protein